MTARPRAVVLTSTYLRHRWLIGRAASALTLVGAWQEEKSFNPQQYGKTADDQAVIAAHFAARDASEDAFFSDARRLAVDPGSHHQRTGAPGLVNDSVEIDAMAALRPDVVLVFGTGLLRRGIIGRFDGRILNLHLGLSPYYRGAGTNFWPLVNREPEYVGATVHYLDAGIDSGPIIAHARPSIEPGDGPHELGNKAIAAGVETLLQAARAHCSGGVQAVPQAGGGRLYQRKHFSADAVRRLEANFRTGMIAEYLADRDARDARLALLSLAEPA